MEKPAGVLARNVVSEGSSCSIPDQYSRFHLKMYQSRSVLVIGANLAKTPPHTVSQQCTQIFCQSFPVSTIIRDK